MAAKFLVSSTGSTLVTSPPVISASLLSDSKLQSSPLKEEAEEFVQGAAEAVHWFPLLCLFVAQFKFGSCVERVVEGAHAFIHQVYLRGHARTEAYDSLELRMAQVRELIQSPKSFGALCQCLTEARSPKRLVAALGMAEHPSLSACQEHLGQPLP